MKVVKRYMVQDGKAWAPPHWDPLSVWCSESGNIYIQALVNCHDPAVALKSIKLVRFEGMGLTSILDDDMYSYRYIGGVSENNEILYHVFEEIEKNASD